MRAAEIMRKFAELIDTAQSEKGHLTRVDSDMPGEHEPSENDPDPVMVPPLQQHLELLKRSAGVENFYDDEEEYEEDEGDCGCGCNGAGTCETGEEEPEDELDQIKRIAGIRIITGIPGQQVR